jgi:hypothetical protein
MLCGAGVLALAAWRHGQGSRGGRKPRTRAWIGPRSELGRSRRVASNPQRFVWYAVLVHPPARQTPCACVAVCPAHCSPPRWLCIVALRNLLFIEGEKKSKDILAINLEPPWHSSEHCGNPWPCRCVILLHVGRRSLQCGRHTSRRDY